MRTERRREGARGKPAETKGDALEEGEEGEGSPVISLISRQPRLFLQKVPEVSAAHNDVSLARSTLKT